MCDFAHSNFYQGAPVSDPFLAQITMFGGNFAPRSWSFCDGQLLAISQYNALFSLLGTTYGGDGRTTFGLPDLRGRAPVGPRSGPGLSTYTLGQRGGYETVALNQNEMPQHTHAAVSVMNAYDGGTNETAAEDGSLSNGNLYNTGAPDVAMHASSVTTTVNAAGNGQAHENRQPYLAVNYIIAIQGTFPSRS